MTARRIITNSNPMKLRHGHIAPMAEADSYFWDWLRENKPELYEVRR